MERKAVEFLNKGRLMALATLRADGWPQATMVGYANAGLLIYFMISRQSQKFTNIQQDPRVSIAIGHEVDDVTQITGLSIAAYASEVSDPDQREHAYELILQRHPECRGYSAPNLVESAIMRARCSIVTIIDFHKGMGHADVITVGASGLTVMEPARPDDWGFDPSPFSSA